ncbi:kinase D-interacting substrate of 220 kDa B-like [Chelonus insularis]|uniref:kinase D-interacting substrate of 220 kDa B-like n=1 Tax=Chelonus insularis TaxID=460826 RepID=UPI001588AD33|nr:kinase D-interacting substrate of 220 kDa B-like [Chelonus insularis]
MITFSDVNLRSMRRLMNVFYVMGRLLKAFQIDFNWYHLASWINITEQWPFKTSWMILHYEMYEDTFEDSMSLKTLYDKVRSQIPVLKNVQLFKRKHSPTHFFRKNEQFAIFKMIYIMYQILVVSFLSCLKKANLHYVTVYFLFTVK